LIFFKKLKKTTGVLTQPFRHRAKQLPSFHQLKKCFPNY